MTENFKELREALAARPTQGKWQHVSSSGGRENYVYSDKVYPRSQAPIKVAWIPQLNPREAQDATYIAAANPQTIAALLQERDDYASAVDSEVTMVNRLTDDLNTAREELDAVIADWNAVVAASGSPTNGGVVGYVTAMRRILDTARATTDLREREITQLIKERDSSENAIDKILDRVLGEDRTEWSNAYQIGDAIDEVDVAVTTLEKELDAARAEIARLTTLRPMSEWHEDDGLALWWQMPINEGPYCGSPLSSEWPYGELDEEHLQWIPLPIPEAKP